MKPKPSKLAASLIAKTMQQAPPKIEFPCADYPIKVIGHNADDFKQFVIDTMLTYDDQLDLEKVTHQDSKNGKFRSIRLFMTAKSELQLKELNDQLKTSKRVVTVL
jgi:putative lipoic acid-binding regulatory protein